MGASTFTNRVNGKDVKEAFRSAVESACYENGHGGYTGSIAEKHDFVMIGKACSIEEARRYADKLMDDDDNRISDKWGPAGCIEYPGGYLFFGWASS